MKDHDTDPLGIHMPSDWVQLKLVQLQKELAESDPIPEGLDQLLQILIKPAALAEEKEFGKLLSHIIHDTLQGVVISRRYPAFFERLITDLELRETFLDTLEILELNCSGKLEPLPGEPDSDLSFLYKQPAQPEIHLADSGSWRVVWRQTADQIDTLFTSYQSKTPKAPCRDVADWLDDDRIVLLRDEMAIGEEHYHILLEAIQSEAQPEHLNISLLIRKVPYTLVALEAYVKWGSYEKSLTLDTYNLGRFTAIPLTAVLDQSGRKVIGDLHLEFGPAAAS